MVRVNVLSVFYLACWMDSLEEWAVDLWSYKTSNWTKTTCRSEKSLLALLGCWLIGRLTVHVWLTVAQSAISSWALWLDSSRVQYDAKCADSQLSPSVFLHVTSAASVPFRMVYSWFITRTKLFFTPLLSSVELWIDVNPAASSARPEEYFESAHRHTLLVKLLSQGT